MPTAAPSGSRPRLPKPSSSPFTPWLPAGDPRGEAHARLRTKTSPITPMSSPSAWRTTKRLPTKKRKSRLASSFFVEQLPLGPGAKVEPGAKARPGAKDRPGAKRWRRLGGLGSPGSTSAACSAHPPRRRICPGRTAAPLARRVASSPWPPRRSTGASFTPRHHADLAPPSSATADPVLTACLSMHRGAP